MTLQVFTIGLVVSFIGSIPPGTLNILVLQLGLENKFKTALRFAIAVAIIEYPYAWIAVEFERFIMSSPAVQQNFRLIGASVMLLLGLLGLWSARKPSTFSVKFQSSGFRRGIILSLLNPQAIPWWIAMTAYLKAQGWIVLDSLWQVHSYVFGTAVGALILLTLLAAVARKVSAQFQHNAAFRLAPGAILTVLGIVALFSYFAS